MLRDGKIGPQFGKLGGRPPKVPTEDQLHPRPAAAAVRRAAAANADKIAAVFIDVLNSDASDAQKVRSMKSLLAVEQKEVAIELEERKLTSTPPPPQFGSAEEAANVLAARLASNPILRSRLLASLTAGDPSAGDSSDLG
jgi:hypothetical protein